MGTRQAQPFHSALIKLPAHLFCLPPYRKKHYPGGFRGPMQLGSISRKTTIRREPIEITTPLAHSQYAKNGKTLTMPRKERAQRGVRRPHARAYSRTLYEGSRYGAHYTAKIKCVGSGMLTKFDPRPNESQQFKLPKSLSSKARRVQYH